VDQRRSTEGYVAEILNGGWMVRHYARGARLRFQQAQRSEAIRQLGLTVRQAFACSDDFEPLLTAVVDGLRPRDEQAF
jgi:hypothetical protein